MTPKDLSCLRVYMKDKEEKALESEHQADGHHERATCMDTVTNKMN